ncbi:MAG: prepilin-type N-terminal cleavage/methylation domain-containing protein [Rubrivivax sp.]|nr:MAG: prepilin-type N-terminal cleavage/methylation domain-containing protein [Rubrivivax sp.]
MNKRAFRHRSPRDKGFTLVELMVTVAILVILLAIGVPSMQKFLAKRVALANADTLASGMKFARSEALKRGQPVSMCITTSADNVAPTCANSTVDWASGWLIYVDSTSGCAFNNTQLLVKVQQSFTNSGALTGSAARRCLTFTPDGMALGFNTTVTAAPPGTADSSAKRCVVLSNQGRTQIGLPASNGECN